MRRNEISNYCAEKRYVRKDGGIIWTSLNATIIRESNGTPLRAISTIQDVTERKLAEQLERDRRQVLEMVARDMPLPDVLDHLALALEGQLRGSVITFVVLQEGEMQLHGQRLPGQVRDGILAHSLTLSHKLMAGAWDAVERCGVTYVESDDIWKDIGTLIMRQDFAACWTMGIQTMDTSPVGLLLTFARDPRRPTMAEVQTLDMAAKLAAICIEHHHTTRQLSHLVRHDRLTGLPNRMLFEERLQHALALADRSSKQVGVMVLDIDRFKLINDSFGHHAGDELLQQFATRLRARLRETDTMARLGGDEFAIVLPNLEHRHDADVVARKLVESLAAPFELGQGKLAATTSIGIATFPDDGRDPVTLLKKADEALYRIKQGGRNGFGY